jgi:hypothetical protein
MGRGHLHAERFDAQHPRSRPCSGLTNQDFLFPVPRYRGCGYSFDDASFLMSLSPKPMIPSPDVANRNGTCRKTPTATAIFWSSSTRLFEFDSSFQKKPEILEFSFVCIFGLRMLCPFAPTPAW